MAATVEVPGRGRKWVMGALVRDVAGTLYRVTSGSIGYHEDALPMQRVSKVRDVPPEWSSVQRLLAIMEAVVKTGTHEPFSRGVAGDGVKAPEAEGPSATWEAREDARSYAHYPTITVRGDVLRYVRPVYDDAPVCAWVQDSALADEVRALLAHKPTLTRYPLVRVRASKG